MIEQFVVDLQSFFEKPIDAFKDSVRKGLDVGPSVLIVILQMETIISGQVVILGETHTCNFESGCHDRVHHQGFLHCFFVDVDADLGHLNFRFFVLVLGRLLRVLMLVLEVGGRSDLGDQSHLIVAYGFTQLNQKVLFGEGPSCVFKFVFVLTDVLGITLLLLDLVLKNFF